MKSQLNLIKKSKSSNTIIEKINKNRNEDIIINTNKITELSQENSMELINNENSLNKIFDNNSFLKNNQRDTPSFKENINNKINNKEKVEHEKK